MNYIAAIDSYNIKKLKPRTNLKKEYYYYRHQKIVIGQFYYYYYHYYYWIGPCRSCLKVVSLVEGVTSMERYKLPLVADYLPPVFVPL